MELWFLGIHELLGDINFLNKAIFGTRYLERSTV